MLNRLKKAYFMMIWKYVAGWFPLVIIAIVNGTFRQIAFQKSLGELYAHQLSTATGLILFGFYIFWFMRWLKPQSYVETVRIGILWLVLTVVFEFSLGRMLGRDWSVLLHDYNLFEGRVWVLVPLWIAIAPSLFFKISGKSDHAA